MKLRVNIHSGVFGEDGQYPTECWTWTGRISRDGYGYYGKELAHRCMYKIWVGRVPKTKHLDHLCRNRSCVNPLHLEIVTPRVNILRGIGACAQHKRQTHCKHGHEFNKDNTYTNNKGHRVCRTCDRSRPRRRQNARA